MARTMRTNHPRIEVMPIGEVESPLTNRASAPKQGHEGAPRRLAGSTPPCLRVSNAYNQGITSSFSRGSIALGAMCCVFIRATTSSTRKRECSTLALPTVRTRSGYTKLRSPRSKVGGSSSESRSIERDTDRRRETRAQTHVTGPSRTRRLHQRGQPERATADGTP